MDWCCGGWQSNNESKQTSQRRAGDSLGSQFRPQFIKEKVWVTAQQQSFSPENEHKIKTFLHQFKVWWSETNHHKIILKPPRACGRSILKNEILIFFQWCRIIHTPQKFHCYFFFFLADLPQIISVDLWPQSFLVLGCWSCRFFTVKYVKALTSIKRRNLLYSWLTRSIGATFISMIAESTFNSHYFGIITLLCLIFQLSSSKRRWCLTESLWTLIWKRLVQK